MWYTYYKIYWSLIIALTGSDLGRKKIEKKMKKNYNASYCFETMTIHIIGFTRALSQSELNPRQKLFQLLMCNSITSLITKHIFVCFPY